MEKAERVLRLYRERYEGWNVKHFHERLVEEHQIKLSYTWVKAALLGAGLAPKERRRTPHRKERERRPVPGMMLFMDGSPHEWLEGQRHDLILIMDDANNEVYGAEAVTSSIPPARAARRTFQTWQGRIPQEFKDAGIKDAEAANAYLRKHLIGRMNRHFKGRAKEEGTAFIPCRVGDLDAVFSLQHERGVNKDNTIHFGGRLLQIPPVKWRRSLARCTVKVCEHMDGRISVRYGPQVVAWFEADVCTEKKKEDAA